MKHPCMGRCSTSLGDDVCKGCHRTATEVIEWNGYTHEQKIVIIERIEALKMSVNQYPGQWRQINGKGPRHFIIQGYDGLQRLCKSTYTISHTKYQEYISDEEMAANNITAPLCKNCIKSSPKAKASAKVNQ